MNKVQLTQSGLEKLQQELAELKDGKRTKAVQRLHDARAMGDLSENSEYTAAKEDLSFIDGRILEIEHMLKDVEIIENTTQSSKVSLGSFIKVNVNDTDENLQIVGEFEADPMNKKLSSTSPIGKALLNKKVGETIEVKVPAGVMKYKILAIK